MCVCVFTCDCAQHLSASFAQHEAETMPTLEACLDVCLIFAQSRFGQIVSNDAVSDVAYLSQHIWLNQRSRRERERVINKQMVTSDLHMIL